MTDLSGVDQVRFLVRPPITPVLLPPAPGDPTAVDLFAGRVRTIVLTRPSGPAAPKIGTSAPLTGFDPGRHATSPPMRAGL